MSSILKIIVVLKNLKLETERREPSTSEALELLSLGSTSSISSKEEEEEEYHEELQYPKTKKPDYVLMDFGEPENVLLKPGALLMPSFDDMEYIPVKILENGGFSLLRQGSKEANKVLLNPWDKRGASAARLHTQQSWFFLSLSTYMAFRILESDKLEDTDNTGLFLISVFRNNFSIFYIQEDGEFKKMPIMVTYKENGDIRFKLKLSRKRFKNLVQLTNYFSRNTSEFLECRLTRGVRKPRLQSDFNCG